MRGESFPVAALNVVQFPTASVVSTFEDAWSLIPASMKTRSLSRAKLKPIWDRHAKTAGGQDVLIGALRAYLKGDKDLPKSGGPGLQVWLNQGKYDHWIEAGNSVVEAEGLPDRPTFPDEAIRASVVASCGLGWVVSYLDPCELHSDGFITPKTGFALGKLRENARELKAAGIMGIRPKA
jgi:hypothetical protein